MSTPVPEGCHAARDGDCDWSECPQLRDGEPVATGRHCPLDDAFRPVPEGTGTPERGTDADLFGYMDAATPPTGTPDETLRERLIKALGEKWGTEYVHPVTTTETRMRLEAAWGAEFANVALPVVAAELDKRTQTLLTRVRDLWQEFQDADERGEFGDRCEHDPCRVCGFGETLQQMFLALDGSDTAPEHDGCDCAELCEMGPTCPGGMLAGLSGSGCWRAAPAEPTGTPDETLRERLKDEVWREDGLATYPFDGCAVCDDRLNRLTAFVAAELDKRTQALITRCTHTHQDTGECPYCRAERAEATIQELREQARISDATLSAAQDSLQRVRDEVDTILERSKHGLVRLAMVNLKIVMAGGSVEGGYSEDDGADGSPERQP